MRVLLLLAALCAAEGAGSAVRLRDQVSAGLQYALPPVVMSGSGACAAVGGSCPSGYNNAVAGMCCSGSFNHNGGGCTLQSNGTYTGTGVGTCNGVTTTCAEIKPCGPGNNGNNNAPTIFLAMLGALAASML
jgi:hypothetical protein